MVEKDVTGLWINFRERGKDFGEKRKPLERGQFFQGFNRGDYEWGYKWHVLYPMNTYKLPHCSMSSIFSSQIV